MELQKVAFKADDDGGPIRQLLNSFTAEFGAVVDKQLKVFLHAYRSFSQSISQSINQSINQSTGLFVWQLKSWIETGIRLEL